MMQESGLWELLEPVPSRQPLVFPLGLRNLSCHRGEGAAHTDADARQRREKGFLRISGGHGSCKWQSPHISMKTMGRTLCSQLRRVTPNVRRDT